MDHSFQEYSDEDPDSRTLQLVRKLIRAAVPIVVEKPSNTLIHLADINDDKGIINMLLERIANSYVPKRDDRTLFELAIRGDRKTFITNLLYIANFNHRNGEEPPDYEIWNTEVVEYFLRRNGVHVNSLHSSPLWLHVAKGDTKMMKLLLESGANVNNTKDRNWEILHAAVFCRGKQYREIVEILLQNGFTVKPEDVLRNLPLFYTAIEKGYLEIVKALLEYVDVNSTFKDEMTPLHCSVQNGHVVISKMLLSKGANVNAKLKKPNSTPLHFAVSKGYKEITEVLLRCGAKVDSKIITTIKPPYGSIATTSLANNYSEIFELLLENGADINSRYACNGETVLFGIVRCDAAKDVIALLKLGADVNIENKNQYSVRYCANREATIVLNHHLAKLKAANLYLSKKNLLALKFIGRTNQMKSFQNECNEEISRMKSEIIASTDASFYDILSNDVNLLAEYARNENIVRALESDDYKIKFPLYANMIECNFKRGKRRKRVVEERDEFFECISNNLPQLPYPCIKKILSYLTPEDIRNLAGVTRKELLELGYRYFHLRFINIPGFLYEDTEKIFSYLSNDDLKNLVDACKSAKVGNSTFPPLRSPN